MRSVLYRFRDLDKFERMVSGSGDAEFELGIPASESSIEDGEWVLAVFELGAARRATSAACRAAVSPDGARLIFEPRDWRRLAEFAAGEARIAPPIADDTVTPETTKSAAAPILEPLRQPSGTMPRITNRPPSSTARILIVDDDPDIRDVVAAMLEAVGLVCTTASSAEDALDLVLKFPFDLCVFDWNLPRMTGIDLCRAVRREPHLAALPVLFLTANASSQDMVEAFASGADDYVVKPFRAPELGARIFSLLRRARIS